MSYPDCSDKPLPRRGARVIALVCPARRVCVCRSIARKVVGGHRPQGEMRSDRRDTTAAAHRPRLSSCVISWGRVVKYKSCPSVSKVRCSFGAIFSSFPALHWEAPSSPLQIRPGSKNSVNENQRLSLWNCRRCLERDIGRLTYLPPNMGFKPRPKQEFIIGGRKAGVICKAPREFSTGLWARISPQLILTLEIRNEELVEARLISCFKSRRTTNGHLLCVFSWRK